MGIPFNIPFFEENAIENMRGVFSNHKASGDGPFTRRCVQWIEETCSVPKALLTTSCSHALDMTAHLLGIKPGDEVIMPSYTFSSTANAFVGRGAEIVFVNIRPDTMNIDEKLIEKAITPKTKAIVPMHYAGVACEMDTILAIAKEYRLAVVEDAAQGVMASYKGKRLGTLSDYGCYSFHETKNYSMGEGGALLLNNTTQLEQAEIMREKGTDRSRFFRGQVDKYSWVNWGSSYLPSELNAAYLWTQLKKADSINQNRLASWNLYYELLKPAEEKGWIQLPTIPQYCQHNAHMFYLKVKDLEQRSSLIHFLAEKDICSVYHYVPLHSSKAGKKFGRFSGKDEFTTIESERLIRLPLFYGIQSQDIEQVCQQVLRFFKSLL